MKTKNFLLGAIGLLTMASCSDDELVGVNHDGDEIAFNVVTNASSRANTESGGVYCNWNLPETFHVWATTEDGKTYINGDLIQKISRTTVAPRMLITSSKWENQSGIRYWPEGKLNFYASVNAVSEGMAGYDPNYKYNWNGVAPTIDVTIPTDVTAQKDLLYAVKKNQAKATTNTPTPSPAEAPAARSASSGSGTGSGIGVGHQINRANYVTLNFRHALSQVVFTAQNVNPNLPVVISGVSVCNVNSQNTFTYPAVDTEDNITVEGAHPTQMLQSTGSTEPTEFTEPTYPAESWGTWGTPSVPQNHPVTFAAVTIPGNTDQTTDPISLTNTNFTYTETLYPEGADPEEVTRTSEYSKLAMLLLPQTSTAWDRTAKAKEQTSGTYFLVKCLIYNIAGTTFDPASDVCLWGTKNADGTYEAKEVAIPVALNWEQGKKYIYNFIFGKENGGFDPENPENPVLIPIRFGLSVDEFVPMPVITTPEPETDTATEKVEDVPLEELV